MRFVCFLILSLYLGACGGGIKPPEQSFYFWKTRLSSGGEEAAALEKTGSKRLYVRVFDVLSKEGRLVPNQALQGSWPEAWVGIEELVPVVFISNRALLDLKAGGVEAFAKQVLTKVRSVLGTLNLPKNIVIKELQLDCDWTLRTGPLYFSFLKALQSERLARELRFEVYSATIRLHQVKYAAKTGVPPVHRGLLMCYNMGVLGDTLTENSILDLKTLKQYLQGFEAYPLTLDLALPLFSWGVHFRGGELLQILSPLSLEDLELSACCRALGGGNYEVERAGYVGGHYLYPKDRLRLEGSQAQDLQEAWNLLKPKIQHPDWRLIWYHLDSSSLARHSFWQNLVL